jgi:phosphatidylglycerophosphate synthase
MTRARQLLASAPLLIGLSLLAVAVVHADLHSIGDLVRQFGIALPIALLPSAAWHVVRTVAWHRCFPRAARPSFAGAFRVRLAAEAFSFVTIRGVAGEPLKVVLLQPAIPPATAAAAVALERIAYLVVTAAIVGAAALTAMVTLPLSGTWLKIFGGVATAAASIVALVIVLVLRDRRPDRGAAPTPLPTGWRRPVARFTRAFASQLRNLVRADRGQLATLVSMEVAAYGLMALEVWVVLWTTSTPVGVAGAMAIETFTRAASFASAFIPGNIGALEASNVAAAVALNATAGAAALALVRRVRGLVWCLAGFLIYPRPSNTAAQLERHLRRQRHPIAPPRANAGSIRLPDIRPTGQPGIRPPGQPDLRPPGQPDDRTQALVILEDPQSDVLVSERLGGLPIAERIARAARRAGYTRILVWAPRQRPAWEALTRRFRSSLETVAASDTASWWVQVRRLQHARAVTVIAPGFVAGPQLLTAVQNLAPLDPQAIGKPSSEGGVPPTCLFRTMPEHLGSPAALAAHLSQVTRRRISVAPDGTVSGGAWRYSSHGDLRQSERTIRESIIKSTDGVIGRFNRRMSIPLSVALIKWTRFNAHAMSALLILMGLYAGWLFSRGDYTSGVVAAFVSLAASILDGCDGELARLQYKESAFGCWLDTLGDYTYYLAIFTGLTVGLVRHTGWSGFWWVGAAVLLGCLATFGLLILLRGRITDGRPERLRTAANDHFEAKGQTWARVAKDLSTVATRATMPYGILAFAILNLLPVVLVLAAIGAQIYWVSLAFEFRRLVAGPAVVNAT